MAPGNTEEIPRNQQVKHEEEEKESFLVQRPA
jgi:hypothetical protein